MNIHRYVSSAEFAAKSGLLGASNAYRQGVSRQRIREVVLQQRVNAYAAAALRNRAALKSRAADERRDAHFAGLLARFGD